MYLTEMKLTVLFSVFDALTLISSTFSFTFNNLDVVVTELACMNTGLVQI